MDWQRSFLIGAMLVVLYMLFLEWDGFQSKRNLILADSSNQLVIPDIPATTKPQTKESMDDIPVSSPLLNAEKTSNVTDTSTADDINTDARLVVVTTDVLRVHIDTHGGDIVRVELLEHLQNITDKETPFILLNRAQDSTFLAQSGLIGVNGTDTKKEDQYLQQLLVNMS